MVLFTKEYCIQYHQQEPDEFPYRFQVVSYLFCNRFQKKTNFFINESIYNKAVLFHSTVKIEKCGWRVGLTTLPPSISRLSK
jgi:hypothetical protein